jgi:hypothetical protein
MRVDICSHKRACNPGNQNSSTGPATSTHRLTFLPTPTKLITYTPTLEHQALPYIRLQVVAMLDVDQSRDIGLEEFVHAVQTVVYKW